MYLTIKEINELSGELKKLNKKVVSARKRKKNIDFDEEMELLVHYLLNRLDSLKYIAKTEFKNKPRSSGTKSYQ